MDPEYIDEAEVFANEDVEMPFLEDQENHDQEPQQNEEEEGSEHTEVEGAPLFNEANEQEDPPQHEEQQQEEDEPTLNKGGYDEALPEEAGTENLSNQRQAGTSKNEAPNEGDNQQTHVEDHERPSNPEEVNGRGRKRRKKHARPPPSGRDQPAPQNNSEGHAG
nr:submandibular gland secretory Glx-rich protein CA-like [Arachis hypogaea]